MGANLSRLIVIKRKFGKKVVSVCVNFQGSVHGQLRFIYKRQSMLLFSLTEIVAGFIA
jgi:hypothetical protein